MDVLKVCPANYYELNNIRKYIADIYADASLHAQLPETAQLPQIEAPFPEGV